MREKERRGEGLRLACKKTYSLKWRHLIKLTHVSPTTTFGNKNTEPNSSNKTARSSTEACDWCSRTPQNNDTMGTGKGYAPCTWRGMQPCSVEEEPALQGPEAWQLTLELSALWIFSSVVFFFSSIQYRATQVLGTVLSTIHLRRKKRQGIFYMRSINQWYGSFTGYLSESGQGLRLLLKQGVK